MKNIHVLPTDKPSRVYSYKNNLFLTTESHLHSPSMEYQNIYITSDEEIKDCYYFNSKDNAVRKNNNLNHPYHHKIILTTDQDLIADGIQAIDDEFLEWFVNNPSCKWVEVTRPNKCKIVGCGLECILFKTCENIYIGYKIIIPSEQPKQETLEETAERIYTTELVMDVDISGDLQSAFINGAKWQQEQDKNKYSDEEMIELIQFLSMNEEFNGYGSVSKETAKYFLEQFKKK